MTNALIYHNPKCSKSRQALSLLKEHNINTQIFEYLKTPLNRKEIIELLHTLSMNIDEILRNSEEAYKNCNLKEASDSEKIDALIANPILLQRPIVIVGQKGVVARPPELLLNLI